MQFTIFNTLARWFGGNALAEQTGRQRGEPSAPLVEGTANIGVDGALQISTVWACVDKRASVLASLPFFVYQSLGNGRRELARTSRLYGLLHESPNARMTPFEFWRAMVMNHDLRGNAYARIDRDERSGEALALWPMPSDQVEPTVLDNGSMVYLYRIGNDVAALAEENVLHLKNLGNGTIGLAKLDFMRATTDEQAKAQTSASKLFGNSGKPTGLLMVDKVLKPEQRKALSERFAEMAIGSVHRLYVLEADLKYQAISLSPQDQQLLETRHFGVEEICRWFDMPPVLVHHSNVTTWGSGIEQLIDGWYKFSLRTMLVNIEQAVRKRVQTPAQRTRLTAEFSLDALLRASLKDRIEIYAKAVQNGLKSRNECRQLENDPPYEGGDLYTAQSNLLPIDLLGKVKTTTGGSHAPAQDPVAQ
ncbi:MAG: phage portal protein [Paucibacter sp.]|nr:phage portal protein [Roseateles sp.]